MHLETHESSGDFPPFLSFVALITLMYTEPQTRGSQNFVYPLEEMPPLTSLINFHPMYFLQIPAKEPLHEQKYALTQCSLPCLVLAMGEAGERERERRFSCTLL